MFLTVTPQPCFRLPMMDFGSVDLYPAGSDRGYVPYLATVACYGALAAYPNGIPAGGCIIRGKLICSA
jgi:hypothetical protein